MKSAIQFLKTVLVVCLLSVSTIGGAEANAFDLDEVADETPKSYVLSAAYPNPFNPTTTFTLAVRERQKVHISVYNMLGQPVAELFDGILQAGETHSFTIEADDLPSGIYFYRVVGEKFTAARQVTLIK